VAGVAFATEEGGTEVHVFVVIPVRNRLAYTRACLSTLARQSLDHTVVVVDDGSDDGTPEMVRAEFPAAVLLHGDGTLWWTGAMNRGVGWVLANAGARDAVVTLNDDTLLPRDYLSRLVQPLRDRRALLGSVAVSETDGETIVNGGVRVDWWRAKFTPQHRGEVVPYAFPNGGLHDVDVLSGCGTLVPLSAYLELGPYDQRHLPHYGADYEFSRRAVRAGYCVALNSDAVLFLRQEATGLHAAVGRDGVQVFLGSFVSRRSATNLSVRVNFALRAAPRAQLVPFLLCDLTRVVIGTSRRAIRKTPLAHS
jgi:GT2 family glycosyltransferase